MDRQTALAAVSNKLGKRDHLITDGTILSEIVSQQEFLEQRGFLPWFLLASWTTGNVTVAATQAVAAPTSFIREKEKTTLQVLNGSNYQPCPKEDLDFLESQYVGASSAIPTNYALFGSSFLFFPTPDAAYTLRLRYYARDVAISTLADGGTNLWLTNGSAVLVARTSAVLAARHQNPRLAELLAGEYKEADMELMKATAAREAAARDYVRRG